MSAGPKHEIVIIRRGGHGDHDEHHGGVWKIAFADFMTALMAFFLVMWLVSANDKTRASVARYFNPVKLVDATTQPRGLHDPKKDDSGITASPDTKEVEGKSKDMSKDAKGTKPEAPPINETASGREKRLDAAMRDNPMAALAEIAGRGAGDELPKEKAQETPHAAAALVGRKGGSAFRDPFAPPPPMRQSANSSDADMDVTPTASSAPTDSSRNGTSRSVPAAASSDTKGMQSEAESSDGKRSEAEPSDPKAREIARQLKANLIAAGRESGGPALDVRVTSEGLMVSLTDTGTFSMFSNASAVPSKRVVLLMERVAKILTNRPGGVVVRGFTDNKRFRSRRYDNWNLSFDRAQAAHYMLVRGGLADSRIASVEGFADKGARPGVNPASPLNRRIEILLKDEPK